MSGTGQSLLIGSLFSAGSSRLALNQGHEFILAFTVWREACLRDMTLIKLHGKNINSRFKKKTPETILMEIR